MYKLIIAPKAQKELKNIKRIYQKAIGAAFEELTQDPAAGKPLKEDLMGRYSYKIGVYRIIYKINKKDKTVYIITAGHRATVYK